MGLADALESAIGERRGSRSLPPGVPANEEAAFRYVQTASQNGLPATAEALPNGGFQVVSRGTERGTDIQARESLGDVVAAALSGKPVAQSAQQAKPAEPVAAPASPVAPKKKLSERIVGENDSNPLPAGDVALNQLTALGSAVVGGWKGLAHLATGGGLKGAADIVTEEMERGTYQPKDKTAKAMVELLARPENPLNWPAEAGAWLGGKTADVTGSPAAGAAVNAAITAAPLALIRGAKRPVLEQQAPTMPLGKQSAVETTSQLPPVNEQPALFRKQAAKAEPVAAAQAAPEAPKFAQSVQEVKAAPKAEQTAAVPVPEQFAKLGSPEHVNRASILQRVGIEEARRSAIEADAKGGATDYQTSKLDNAAGNFMRSVLDKERGALTNYAEKLVTETGGTRGLDEAARMTRGNTIIAPLDTLKQYFDRSISALYKEADARAQGRPTSLETFSQTLADDSMLTNSDRVHLRAGVQAYLKKLGMEGENGAAGTVAQAETVRKYLNENWSPQNSKFVGALKDALDNDVTKAAGEDIYKQARAMRSMRAVTLDDPKGIAKLMDAAGPEGINRAVAIEKIADTVTSLPVEQFKHILATLKNVPAEMQPQAQAAIAEIKAQIANKILEKGSSQQGQWAAKSVSQYLQANAEKLGTLFTEKELASIRDLNDAGLILAKDQSYPGAAVQEHNLVRRGAMAALRSGATAAGSLVGGPAGAALGGIVGDQMASKVGAVASENAAKKRVVKLSEVGK